MIPRLIARMFIRESSNSSMGKSMVLVAGIGGGFMAILAVPLLVAAMLLMAMSGFNSNSAQAATCLNTGTGESPELEAGELPDIVLPLCSGYYLTSPAGYRGSVGDLNTVPFHRGVDLAHGNDVACGQPIMAIKSGMVSLSDRMTLTILHDDGTIAEYLHSERSDRVVKTGQRVTTGQLIATVGNVQPSTNCHLDIRIRTDLSVDPEMKKIPKIDGGYIDPEAYFQFYGSNLCHPDHCTRLQ